MTRADLAALANRDAASSRISGAPRLTADSTTRELIAWFAWNDPNGSWRDCDGNPEDGDDCGECPRCQPLTDEDAWIVLAIMLDQLTEEEALHARHQERA